jgi:protein-S-isoprenylcysteine O-methyltransferase Ste14
VVWHTYGPGLFLYLLQFVGVVLTISAARIVGVRELAGLRQPDADRTIEFTTSGPFGIVRHPIYLGWVLMVFASPVMTTSRLLFAVVSTLYLAIAIPYEEAGLIDAHGDRYRDYQSRMRWRLIPGLW